MSLCIYVPMPCKSFYQKKHQNCPCGVKNFLHLNIAMAFPLPTKFHYLSRHDILSEGIDMLFHPNRGSTWQSIKMKSRPISLMCFHRNLNLMEILFCSHLNFIKLIATKIALMTWQLSWHVQNYVPILLPEKWLQGNEINIEFELR